jgi:hypothetical protein
LTEIPPRRPCVAGCGERDGGAHSTVLGPREDHGPVVPGEAAPMPPIIVDASAAP